jgi:hypothetical protein
MAPDWEQLMAALKCVDLELGILAVTEFRW